MRERALLWALALAGLGCSSGFLRPSGEPRASRYGQLTSEQALEVARAREAAERGEPAAALEIAHAVAAAQPENIAVGRFEQELELEAAEPAQRAAVLQQLRTSTRAAAESESSSARWVLAARLASDVEDAKGMLQAALELDPRCEWAYYGLAYLQAREGNWAKAQEELARALELDPFLSPARLMQAGMLARSGRSKDGIEAYSAWLEDTEGDPLIGSSERLGPTLDMATLYVLGDRPEEAIEVLDDLGGALLDDVRALLIRAAAQQGDGQLDAALATAERASEIDPEAELAWVQIATLQENWLARPDDARASWEKLLAVTEKRSDLASLLLEMRARVELERAGAPQGSARPASQVQP